LFEQLGEWSIPLGSGLVLAYLLCFALAPAAIPLLRRLKFGQTVREDGPQSHLQKGGTPTMGGLVFFAAVCIGGLLPTLLLPECSPQMGLAASLCALGFGLIGFADDFLKVVKKRSLGLNAKQKLAGQVVLGLGLAAYVFYSKQGPAWLLPWGGVWNLGWWFIPITAFIAVGFTNAVNLIDGLDGLCSTVTAVVMGAMALLLAIYALSVRGADPALSAQLMGLAVFTGAAAGACLAFLRVNVFPAKVFMGDTGAMFLGGAVVAAYVLSGFTLLLPVMGGLYLITACSVMLQVAYYKRTKKRILKMAPLHHHFELCGWSETQIVAVYTSVTVLLCLAAFILVS